MSREVAGYRPALHFLSDMLYFMCPLFSFSSLVHHVVQHYRDRVGVQVEHMMFWLGLNIRHDIRASQLALQNAGIPATSIRIINASNSSAGIIRSWSAMLNAHILELPVGAYFIKADVDEFFTYPCYMESLIRRMQHQNKPLNFCAQMQDGTAANGKLQKIQESPDVLQQFPGRCYIRQCMRGMMRLPVKTHKTILFKVHYACNGASKHVHEAASGTCTRAFRLIAGHDLATDPDMLHLPANGCTYLGDFVHTTFTTEALRAYENMLALVTPHDSYLAKQYRTQVNFMYKYLPNTTEDVRRNKCCAIAHRTLLPHDTAPYVNGTCASR